jgi:Protein of unknown function (DUF465).
MTSDRRQESLQRRHAELDRLIEEEQRKPVPDQDEIRRLKALKLDSKDRLHGIKQDG